MRAQTIPNQIWKILTLKNNPTEDQRRTTQPAVAFVSSHDTVEIHRITDSEIRCTVKFTVHELNDNNMFRDDGCMFVREVRTAYRVKNMQSGNPMVTMEPFDIM